MNDDGPDTDPLGSVIEEFLEAANAGAAPSVEEYAARYPLLADELRGVLPTVLALERGVRPDSEPVTLGPYQVRGRLGAGGMGIVYEALDPRLGRTVAIKILTPDRPSNSTARRRFAVEARAVAALSHPNICTLYDIGTADGVDYLVMEHLEGETLADRLRRGALPVAETLTCARQIAGALEEAHRQGILHRDLKPGNIMLTEAGVKLLDFGLARLLQPRLAGRPADADEEATRLTQRGAVLGTPAYMSPEQARGEEVDRRTDVWAFGAVLFEMLTGLSPFAAAAGPDTLARILEREPDWDALPPGTPHTIRSLLRACLAKRADDRLDSMADARLTVEQSLDHPAAARRGLLRRSLPWLGAAAALTAAWWMWPESRPASDLEDPVRFVQLTARPGLETDPALSPDGRFLAYSSDGAGNFDIFLRRVRGSNPINLTEGEAGDDRGPAFSPDGEQIAFDSVRDGQPGIFVMGATGESVKRLTDFGASPTWSPDGRRIAFVTRRAWSPYDRSVRSQLWIVDVETQETRLLFDGDAMEPSWSPSGDRIAFWSMAVFWPSESDQALKAPSSAGQRDIWTISADGQEVVRLTDSLYTDFSPAWHPKGDFVYFSSVRGATPDIWRIPVDEITGNPLGEAQQVTRSGSVGHIEVSFSGDGASMAYTEEREESNLYKIAFDPESNSAMGDPAPVTEGHRRVFWSDLSADGQRLVFSTGPGREDLFTVRSDGSELQRLTDDDYRYRRPRWSPDGRRIAFDSNRGGSYQVWTMNRDGGGLKQVTRHEGPGLIYPAWSPDGRTLSFLDLNARITYLLPLSSEWASESLTEIRDFRAWDWSPDGRKLASVLPLQVYSLETGRLVEGLRFGGQVAVRWLPDSRRLVSSGGDLNRGQSLMLLDTVTGDFRKLFAAARGTGILVAGVAPDMRAVFFTILSPRERDIWLMSAAG